MKKIFGGISLTWPKVIIMAIIVGIILLFAIDLVCIYTINRPLFAIKEDNGDSVDLIYRGVFYDTYNCHEYSALQIKAKGSKFTCHGVEFNKVKDNNEEHHFKAKVIEVQNGYIIVEPNEDEEERNSSDRFHIDNKSNVNYKEGQILAITYIGEINESYPAQIGVTNISIIESN